MKKYEYLVKQYGGDTKSLQDLLDAMEAHGWRLVGFSGENGTLVVFERKVREGKAGKRT